MKYWPEILALIYLILLIWYVIKRAPPIDPARFSNDVGRKSRELEYHMARMRKLRERART